MSQVVSKAQMEVTLPHREPPSVSRLRQRLALLTQSRALKHQSLGAHYWTLVLRSGTASQNLAIRLSVQETRN